MKRWIHKEKKQILVNEEFLDNYVQNGWILGMNSDTSKKISDSLKGRSIGRCLDEYKEHERRRKISESLKGNKNWMFNKKHGNAHKGHYNGIFCDSSWELAFLVYYIEHNLYIKRCDLKFEYFWNNEKHLYFPDFITDEGIIEIKGRIDEKAKAKMNQYPSIIIYGKDKMKPILQYIEEKYGSEFWKHLYDEYSDTPCKKIKKTGDEKIQGRLEVYLSVLKILDQIDLKKWNRSSQIISLLNEKFGMNITSKVLRNSIKANDLILFDTIYNRRDLGSKNQCWVKKGNESKRISLNILEKYIKEGWIKGRLL